MRVNKVTATLLVMILCQAVVLVSRAHRTQQAATNPMAASRDRVWGYPSAKIRITEYADFQCGACQKAALLLARLIKKYPKDFYIKSHYFPLAGHRHGLRSAVYAECASRQGKFWDYSELLFQRQAQWSALVDADAAFKGYAAELALDQGKMEACVNDPSVEQKIINEKRHGATLGVNQTPSFFVNGKFIVGYKSLVDELRVFYPNETYEEIETHAGHAH